MSGTIIGDSSEALLVYLNFLFLRENIDDLRQADVEEHGCAFDRMIQGEKILTSRKGNPYDNALMESFYRTIKRELIQVANFENPEQAQMEVFKYIELYYNTKRIHSSLGYVSQIQFENQL